MKSLILIPARFESSRFPGKPLARLGGKPMIEWVYETAVSVSSNTFVATDDLRIFDAVTAFGGKAIMTSPTHRTGTDRCVEAYRSLNLKCDAVVNLQGDEPFLREETIRSLIGRFQDETTRIATMVKRIEHEEELDDPNTVKVVCDESHRALYFSRLPIPFLRDCPKTDRINRHPFYKHIGIYAFRPSVLEAISALPQSTLEKAESLEQLRWLEAGYPIHTIESCFESVGIDTPEDLQRAETILLK